MANIDNLASEITKALQQYTTEVEEEITVASEEVAKMAVDKLKQTSPKKTGKYAKSWTKSKEGNKWIVHNRKYQVTHLLEKGHAKIGGGRVPAKVHIAPVEDVVIKEFVDRVERAIGQ